MIRLVFVLGLDLLAAKGRSMVILWVQVVWFLALVVGLWWGATRHGLVGVGIAQLAAALLVALPLVTRCLSGEGVHVGPLLARLVRPLLGGAAMTAACLLARAPFEATFVRLVTGSVAGGAAYALVTLPGTPLGRHLWVLLRHRRLAPTGPVGTP